MDGGSLSSVLSVSALTGVLRAELRRGGVLPLVLVCAVSLFLTRVRSVVSSLVAVVVATQPPCENIQIIFPRSGDDLCGCWAGADPIGRAPTPPRPGSSLKGQGKGVPLTTTLLLMVISHKFTNNLILLVHPELLLTTLLTSKPRCQSGPGVGSDHVSSKSR